MRKKRVSNLEVLSEENIFESESEVEKRKYKVILVASNYLVVDLEERGNYKMEKKDDGSVKIGDRIFVDI